MFQMLRVVNKAKNTASMSQRKFPLCHTHRMEFNHNLFYYLQPCFSYCDMYKCPKLKMPIESAMLGEKTTEETIAVLKPGARSSQGSAGIIL